MWPIHNHCFVFKYEFLQLTLNALLADAFLHCFYVFFLCTIEKEIAQIGFSHKTIAKRHTRYRLSGNCAFFKVYAKNESFKDCLHVKNPIT